VLRVKSYTYVHVHGVHAHLFLTSIYEYYYTGKKYDFMYGTVFDRAYAHYIHRILWENEKRRGGGGRGRKSLKVFMVELKVIISRVFGHVSIKIMLKINRERSERRKIEKNLHSGHKKHRSAAVRGGAPGAPPLDPLVTLVS